LQHAVTCDNECLVLESQWDEILRSIKIVSNTNLNVYERVTKLKKLPIFSFVPEIKLFQIANKLKMKHFIIGEEIIREGTMGDTLYILNQGKVRFYCNNVQIRELEPHSCFGEISLLTNNVRSTTVKAIENTECYLIDRNSINEIIDANLLKYLSKIVSLHDLTIELEDLYYVKTLGHGRYGNVLLTHNNKNVYALKCAIIKEVCSKTSLIQYYLTEKRIMLQIDHPFVCKLVKTIRTKQFLFFLLEFVDGMCLRSYLDKRKQSSLRNKGELIFYGAILLTILNYLHKKNILHRDIKPDNLLIDVNVK
jgi:hypothetical protein